MGTEISSFDHVRLIGKWPAAIDVSQYGALRLIASVFLVRNQSKESWEGQIVKALLKDNMLGLFVAYYPDSELPEWWADARVLFEHRQPLAEEEKIG